MSNPLRVDYIIVGLGIAGSCLAIQMLLAGKRILVIDPLKDATASKVAAGLFNPITGNRMTKTWMADKLFPYLLDFYATAEKILDAKFLHELPVYRPFLSVEEQNEWMARSADPSFAPFIENVHIRPLEFQGINNEYGGLQIKSSGYINTAGFCNGVARVLEDRGMLHRSEFDESRLEIESNGLRYGNWEASRLVFCTGEHLTTGQFWGWLPIRPLKGEVLTVETDVSFPMIVNRGVYWVPGINKVGATYNKTDLIRSPTMEARLELEQKFMELVSVDFKVKEQAWAMRPTTPDRRPILGTHPEFGQLVVFNGLGTKGVSLAPYFSGVLFDWLEKGMEINEEVALNRYKSLYWKSA